MSDPGRTLRTATASVAGRRPHQEDAVRTETLRDGRTVVAVADGMGGHAAGEVASALALECLIEALEEDRSLREAFRLANSRVRSKAEEPGKQGMGTTLVAVVLDGDRYEVANVGDSRGYVLSADGIRQITRDHSYVAEAVDRGTPREEAEASKWKDALTRSIGTDAEVEVDLFGPFTVEPDTAVLLCSDGLYKVVSDTALKEVYQRSESPRGGTQALVAAALEGGSDDNISVAVAEFGRLRRTRPGDTQEFVVSPELRAKYEEEPSSGNGGASATEPLARIRERPWIVGLAALVLLLVAIAIVLASG